MRAAAVVVLFLAVGCASAPAVVAPAVAQLDAVLSDEAVKSLPAASRATLTAAVTQARAEVLEALREAESAAFWREWGGRAVAFVAGLVFGWIIRRF